MVTARDSVREVCPFFPGEKKLHKSFPDPAAFQGAEEAVLPKVRAVRDEIKEWVDFTLCKGNITAEKEGFM